MSDSAVQQLPRGRHHLSREQVLASQRGRLLAAVIEVVVEKGFARTSVADVIRRAGVSRETFYEQFADKEDCFVSALDAAAEAMLGALGEALTPPEGTVAERLDHVLTAYLRELAAEPVVAKAFLIDAYGAGARAMAKRFELQQRFVELMRELVGARSEADRFACEAIVAAVSSLVTVRVGAGETVELLTLRRPLLQLAARLLPAAAERAAA